MINTAGIKIGHATDTTAHTGCSVFLLPDGCTVSADIRGPAPGSREYALLLPDKRIDAINAILLTGGSALGLSSADGVVRYLDENDIGHYTPIRKIPLVAGSVVFDLFFSRGDTIPSADMAYSAAQTAVLDNTDMGNIGAGAGVSVGKWAGIPRMMKGGYGIAGVETDGLVVFASAVVNAVGDVVRKDGEILAGARSDDGGWQVTHNPYRTPDPSMLRGTNTTLVVVGTNATLSKPLVHRLCHRIHDGMAIAIRPVHTSHDGDSAYAVATNQIDASWDAVANIITEIVPAAIRNAVIHAKTIDGILGLGSKTNNQ